MENVKMVRCKCGGHPQVSMYHIWYRGQCTHCDRHTGWKDSIIKAVEEWNEIMTKGIMDE